MTIYNVVENNQRIILVEYRHGKDGRVAIGDHPILGWKVGDCGSNPPSAITVDGAVRQDDNRVLAYVISPAPAGKRYAATYRYQFLADGAVFCGAGEARAHAGRLLGITPLYRTISGGQRVISYDGGQAWLPESVLA